MARHPNKSKYCKCIQMAASCEWLRYQKGSSWVDNISSWKGNQGTHTRSCMWYSRDSSWICARFLVMICGQACSQRVGEPPKLGVCRLCFGAFGCDGIWADSQTVRHPDRQQKAERKWELGWTRPVKLNSSSKWRVGVVEKQFVTFSGLWPTLFQNA